MWGRAVILSLLFSMPARRCARAVRLCQGRPPWGGRAGAEEVRWGGEEEARGRLGRRHAEQRSPRGGKAAALGARHSRRARTGACRWRGAPLEREAGRGGGWAGRSAEESGCASGEPLGAAVRLPAPGEARSGVGRRRGGPSGRDGTLGRAGRCCVEGE